MMMSVHVDAVVEVEDAVSVEVVGVVTVVDDGDDAMVTVTGMVADCFSHDFFRNRKRYDAYLEMACWC